MRHLYQRQKLIPLKQMLRNRCPRLKNENQKTNNNIRSVNVGHNESLYKQHMDNTLLQISVSKVISFVDISNNHCTIQEDHSAIRIKKKTTAEPDRLGCTLLNCPPAPSSFSIVYKRGFIFVQTQSDDLPGFRHLHDGCLTTAGFNVTFGEHTSSHDRVCSWITSWHVTSVCWNSQRLAYFAILAETTQMPHLFRDRKSQTGH